MKLFLIALTLLTASFSFSKELEIPVLQPDSVFADSSLNKTSMVHFSFPNVKHLPEGTSVTYSIDGKQGTHGLLDNNGVLTLETSEGWHNLQFYYSTSFHEEYTSIDIDGGNQYYFSVYFESSEIMIMTEKPVIYLYPEEEQDIHVKVHPKGEFTFTYPSYDNGWDVTANPNGKLKVDGELYNYLFWEASEKLNPNDVNTNIGFIVAGESITDFLEEKLTLAGLNGNERADFITFWAPRMATHSDIFLQFHINKECDRFGTLDISPKPDNLYRIYMVWQPVDQLRIAPTPQTIEPMNRSGFTVLEWGGQELPSMTNTSEL